MSPSHLLFPHPTTPISWIRRLEVDWRQDDGGGLTLRYALTGDTARLRIPPPAAPTRQDGLWRHTCCELFTAAEREAGYREFNFSPSSAWQAYGFRSYREGAPLEPVPAPTINVETGSNTLVLTARLPSGALPSGGRLRVGFTAVIEATDGSLSYWALAHPPGKPDFHNADTFALDLDLRNSPP